MRICPLVTVILLLSTVGAAEVSTVYYLGDCLPTTSPIALIGDDPAINVIAVPATVHSGYFTYDEAKRALRLYLPRTYGELLDGDLILLSDVRADTLPVKWLDWFSQSVEDGGLGLLMIGGILSFGGYSDSPPWDITSIGPLLPVDLVERQTTSVPWKPVIVAEEDQLMTALPWKTSPFFHGYNDVKIRDGALLLAVTSDAKRNPFMASWNIGNGRSFAFCTDWTPGWGVDFMKWNYYPDLTVYAVYYSSGKEVPQDVELMHLLRSELINYKMQKDVLVSLINFVEKVGANVVGLEMMIRDVDAIREEAGDLYIMQDYEECVATLERGRRELDRIEMEAVEVKARAFLWIWLIEWLAVSGAFMVTGTILWTLMIKRRLYREVKTTRTF
ncbi:MAG: hypothetical protein HXS50_05320 [Theionarchaea archaeon]|nr:hypothetical protein [Theionarchaea archaeon]